MEANTPPPAPSPAAPMAPAPARRQNPSIRRAATPVAPPTEPEEDAPVNNDGFIPGQEITWEQLQVHKAKIKAKAKAQAEDPTE